MQTAPNDLQLLFAFAIFIVACGGPLRWVWERYRRASFLQLRPWRAVAVLLLSPVVVFPAGYVAVLVLSFIARSLGWSFFNGDDGFKVLFALLWSCIFLVFAGIVVGMLTMAGRLPGGSLGHKDGRDTADE